MQSPFSFQFLLMLLVWLRRSKRFKGDLTLLNCIAIGSSPSVSTPQYRLFTDPEYSSGQKSAARLREDDTLRQRYVNDYYDAEKKRALFADPNV